MNKKLFILIIAVAFIAGVFGGAISGAQLAKANLEGKFSVFYGASVLDNFHNWIKNLIPKKEDLKEDLNVPQKESFVPYAPTVDYEQAVIKAVENSSPAVVSIIISKNVPIIEQCPYNPFSDLPPEFQRFFGGGLQFSQPCQKGTKLQEVGGGSGFIISDDGLILTNKHVVLEKDASYTVMTNDGKKYDAKVLAQDPVLDLAVVKINAHALPVLKLGNSDSLKLGQTSIAIGNALGEFRNTVSVGVISGLARTITASGSGGFSETIEGVIQTDAAINAGNSGGPLLNLKGEVIGISVAMVSGAQNVGFAIPINQAKRAIESIKKTGRIITPYLGVRYLIITPELAKKEKLSIDYGALIRGSSDGPAIVKDSPASKAGLQAEDIILELNGQKIDQDHSLASLIQKYNVGDTVTLKILRNKKEMEIKITLGERP